MKQNPLDGSSVPEPKPRSHIPLPDKAITMPAMSNYEGGTYEFETESLAVGDKEVPKQELDEKQTYGLNIEALRPELALKYKDIRQFWDSYFDISQKEWGKPEDITPMVLWVRKHPDYLVSRSEILVNAPLEEVVRILRDDELSLKIDSRKKSLSMLRDESPQCSVVHTVNKGTGLIDERDNVVYRFQFFEDADTFRILNFPADDINHPPAKGVVRVDMKLLGVILTREGKNSTKMVSCAMINPRLPIPMFMMRSKLKEHTLFIVTVKKEIEKLATMLS